MSSTKCVLCSVAVPTLISLNPISTLGVSIPLSETIRNWRWEWLGLRLMLCMNRISTEHTVCVGVCAQFPARYQCALVVWGAEGDLINIQCCSNAHLALQVHSSPRQEQQFYNPIIPLLAGIIEWEESILCAWEYNKP